MSTDFIKMHGLGNDFVVIEDLDDELSLSAATVASICDRHTGVGADGLILIRRLDGDLYMHYQNADGSLAEMCGNGIRCFAKYVVDAGLVSEDSFDVGTLGGARRIEVSRDEGGVFAAATVDMGVPVLDPASIPVVTDEEIVQATKVETSHGPVFITAVSMGNPHAVIFVDDVDAAPVETLGPELESHSMFPNQTNVEFAQVLPDERIRLRVWERGVGETLACGTGACATVVAASLGCEIGTEAVVELPGGALGIRWAPNRTVYMTGPATEVFRGTLEL